jgi:two-component system CheB/CheR fusion protein
MRKMKSDNNQLFIVGIGASAGGLEALSEFFKAMPADKGLAFVVVVHLDPHHVSLLPELLQKQTTMTVVQITDGIHIEANTVYVIPPDKNLSILNGQLHLLKMELPRFNYLPINLFFRSLAQDQHDKAISIILSGTGSDGTQGIKEIKAEAGLVLVQDEKSAKYEGMPKSAIATGLVDYILPPNAMPDKLIAYTKFPHSTKALAQNEQEQADMVLQKIYLIIRNKTGHDFSLYKKNTLYRRIERRMHLHQIEKIVDYLAFLQRNEQEVSTLAKELLIGVTRFFRDPEAYNVLLHKILPEWLAQKPDNYTVRIWTVACSTGEEAYSMAMILQECLESMNLHLNVQIFGTDIDGTAIETARRGIYPASISADVSSERLNRFFTKQDNQFKIKKSIRDMLVFATQNITKDPPFTKLDMITCRNLLIYFSSELQNKIIPIFHYSLKEEGILFLGTSETTGHSNHFFIPIDRKWKLFRRKNLLTGDSRNTLRATQSTESLIKADAVAPNLIEKAEELSIMQLVEAILRQSTTPPCVIINANKDIIYVHGKLSKYLEPAEGKISVNVIDMVRSELKAELLATIRKVTQTKQKIQIKGCSFHYEGRSAFVDLSVSPIAEQSSMSELLMVVFEELPLSPSNISPTDHSPVTTKNTERLQQELNATKASLQITIEELETAIDELKSTNEELQSTNEELQSSNEELETSKEELQSLHEEAITVNAELQGRIDDCQTVNDDVKNLFDSTQIATIFLDTHLYIRRFTPKAKDIINLVLSDIGRPVAHLTSSLLNTNLSALADHVLKTLEKQESEIYDTLGRCFLVHIMPYRTLNNVIDGVIVTFENITARKNSELALVASEQRYKQLFDHFPLPLWIEDFSRVVQTFTAWREQGLVDLNEYLTQQPEELAKLIKLIHIKQVNPATLDLFNCHDKEELALILPLLLTYRTNAPFLSQLLAIWNRQDKLRLPYVCHDIHGNPLNFSVAWTVPNESNRVDYGNVIGVVNSINTNK